MWGAVICISNKTKGKSYGIFPPRSTSPAVGYFEISWRTAERERQSGREDMGDFFPLILKSAPQTTSRIAWTNPDWKSNYKIPTKSRPCLSRFQKIFRLTPRSKFWTFFFFPFPHPGNEWPIPSNRTLCIMEKIKRRNTMFP